LALTGVLCGIWSMALRVLPRPALAETNYEANRLRVEGWLLGPGSRSVLVGTSMSGRLLPSYFEGTALSGIANLGLDGASPDTGLRLTLMRRPVPDLVLLEGHLLSKRSGPNDRQLLELATGVGMQITALAPLTRADARPSTVLYGWLKERRGGPETGAAGGGAATGTVTARVVSAAQAEKDAAGLDPDWRPRIRTLIATLQEQGSRVVLVRLPSGVGDPAHPEAPNELDAIAGELGLPLVDLLRTARREQVPVSYTDGLHLTPQAARAVSRVLAESVASAGWMGGIRSGPGEGGAGGAGPQGKGTEGTSR
ncbi:MAG: hypothetical protein JNL10_07585, partial [Verrucomicrobiales bacterium]|nr:hypothetical protein [Verrucomicrobiales bacterium]